MPIEYNEDAIDSGPANVYIERDLTGTVAVASGTLTQIDGTGTKFQSELVVGQTVFLEGAERVIQTITSNTAVIVATAFSGAVTAGKKLSALYNVGGIKDGVTLQTETSVFEKTIDQMGDSPIGATIKGRKAKLMVGFAEVSPERFRFVFAEALGYTKKSTGEEIYRATPSVGVDLFDAARRIRIIPVIGGTETTNKNKIFNIHKAAPGQSTLELAWQPEGVRNMKAEFSIFPDPTTNELWYVGDRVALT